MNISKEECPDCMMGRGFVVVKINEGIKERVLCCVRGHESEVMPEIDPLERRKRFRCSDADAFYIWENVEDSGVYKVGITSERVGEKRIAQCTNSNGMKANIILIASVPNAREIERKALEMGESVDYSSEIDGYTEFRRYTDQELGEVYRMAVQAA